MRWCVPRDRSPSPSDCLGPNGTFGYNGTGDDGPWVVAMSMSPLQALWSGTGALVAQRQRALYFGYVILVPMARKRSQTRSVPCYPTMGDPAGIGPEVIEGLADKALRGPCQPVVIGSRPVMERTIKWLDFAAWTW